MPAIARARVDLDHNLFICPHGTVRLQPRQAEILSILAIRAPRVVAYDSLISAVYGADAPLAAVGIIRVEISKMRGALAVLGYEIDAQHGMGYRLWPIKFPSRAELARRLRVAPAYLDALLRAAAGIKGDAA